MDFQWYGFLHSAQTSDMSHPLSVSQSAPIRREIITLTFHFHLFIKFYIFIANNSKQLSWRPCLRKEIESTIFITYIFVALSSPRCASATH